MYLKACVLWAFMLLAGSAVAQVAPTFEEAAEQWAEEYGSDEAAGEWHDLMVSLRSHPLNINDTHAVGALPLLSPFQLQALKNYILLHGQLLTIKELTLIPGFDSAEVERIEGLVVAEPFAERKRWYTQRGRLTWVSALGGTVERAAGYRDGTYDGDNLRALTCLTYDISGRLNLRLAYEKDAGEAWGRNNFIGYHLMLNDVGRMERMVLGRFNVQFGQGLTLWTGLAPFHTLGTSDVRYGQGIKAASTFYEEGYQEGAAAMVRLPGGLHASAFASKALGNRLLGGRIDYRTEGLVAGITLAHTLLDDSIEVRDYVYNQNSFRGQRLLNVGGDVLWQVGRWLLYGELAFDDAGSAAGIGGAKLSINSRNSLGFSYRNYSPQYHNLHAQAYGMGQGANERGLALNAQVGLPWGVEGLVSSDLHSNPAPRYGNYSPSAGEWTRVQIGRAWRGGTRAWLRCSWRRKERNVPNVDSTLYVGEPTVRSILQGEVKHSWNHWSSDTRLVFSRFDSHHDAEQHGWLAMQAVQYSRGIWQASLCASYFNVDGYYARIYLTESYLQYAFSIPSLQGEGVRAYAVVRCTVNSQLSISAKYALTAYFDRDYVGSGAARTEGPTRQTWMLQVRWAL